MVKRKLDLVDDRPGKSQKLSAFGFTLKTSESKSVNETVSANKSPSVNRKFNPNWRFDREWLRYDSTLGLMFCDICIKARVQNSFVSGCPQMKKDNILKHENRKGDNSHASAVIKLREGSNMDVAREKALSKSKAAILSALRTTYFAATHDLANAMVPKLNDLCIMQGATSLRDLQVDAHTSYSHNASIQEFQQCLADVVLNRLLCNVRDSRVFSLMLDESTDVSVHQNLVVYIRFLQSVGGSLNPVTHFLGIRQLQVANAESITTELLGLLRDNDVPLSGLVGVSTDGASVMVGSKSGVVTRLREVAPSLLATHCIAHRLALCCGGAADKVRYLVKFQDLLNSMYKYFENSPKNMSRLEAIQDVMLASQGTRLKQVFSTRWLSFEGSVQAVVDNYSRVVSVFLEDSSAKALSMHKPITCFKFLYVAHFLADALKPLAILSKSYQRSDLDFTEVDPLLRSTVKVLEKLQSNPGPYLSDFLSVVPEEPCLDSDGLYTFLFQGHVVRDSLSQRSEAESACRLFISNMVDNIKCRFTEEGDSSTLSALSKVFDPCSLGDERSVKVVANFIEIHGITKSKAAAVRQEFVCFTELCRTQALSSVRDVCMFAVRKRAEYPSVSTAAERLLVAPVSTVDCERGFSRQNLIKTNQRNSLKISTLDNLMRLSMCEDSFDYDSAFKLWGNMKNRRIMVPKY